MSVEHYESDDEMPPLVSIDDSAERHHQTPRVEYRLAPPSITDLLESQYTPPLIAPPEWFSPAFVALCKRVAQTNRYPGLPVTEEARFIKFYPTNPISAPFRRDSVRLRRVKLYYNNHLQEIYNDFERLFGPHPLQDWEPLVKFQQRCDAISCQYMMHCRRCRAWSRCTCHQLYGNGESQPQSLFQGRDHHVAETYKDAALAGSYKVFMEQLHAFWSSRVMALTREIQLREQPLMIRTRYSRGYTVCSFYTGVEQVEDDEEDHGEDALQCYDRQRPWTAPSLIQVAQQPFYESPVMWVQELAELRVREELRLRRETRVFDQHL